jgi:hypothetical protein
MNKDFYCRYQTEMQKQKKNKKRESIRKDEISDECVWKANK